jgi:hypothetical protein
MMISGEALDWGDGGLYADIRLKYWWKLRKIQDLM